MRNRNLLLLPLLALALSILACTTVTQGLSFGANTISGSGTIAEEERAVSNFSKVDVRNQGDLTIEVGEQEELRVEADDNLLEYITTEVRNGTLVFETQEGIQLRTQGPIKYYLTVKELDSITLSSSGDANAPDLEAERFRINIHSSGDLRMEGLTAADVTVQIKSSGDVTIGKIEADNLDININSSGNLSIGEGEVNTQTININSSGDYDARDMQSTESRVNLDSSGNATIRVSDYLEAFLSSSGDVRYLGNPSVESQETSSGRVINIGD